MTVSDKIYKLCTSSDTLSSDFMKSPDKSPGEVAKALYDTHHLKVVDSQPPTDRSPASDEELERARQCGKFGPEKPSELFLRAWNDVLGTIEKDSLAGICSPPLMGSTGVVPFTVIGPVNDIVRHMANLIVRAKKEVLLATNYWMSSSASQLINEALLELSKRAGQRNQKIPVKIMYDRGSLKQFINNHQLASDKELKSPAIRLPGLSDIPNLDLQVVNFHRPLLGTFHAKFMIVDREVAITQSNNIQDNDNVEMMAQVEGPIVDALWETFVISWHAPIQPLACIDETAATKKPPTFQQASFKELFTPEGLYRIPEQHPKDSTLPELLPGKPYYDDDVAGEIHRGHAMMWPRQDESHADAVARHLNHQKRLDVKATAPSPTEASLHFQPFIPLPEHDPVPIAMVSRKPFGSPNHTSLHTPQNEAFLSLIRNAKRSVFIQTPDMNASPLYEALQTAVRRGVTVTAYVCLGYNDAGELLPMQNGTNEMFANSLYRALEKDPGDEAAATVKNRLRIHFYVAKDQTAPIHNSFKQRSCHIKLMIVDDQVAVQGSGNQDTQSWWQSEECNIMVDAPHIARAWREAIERNQNTGAAPVQPTTSNGAAANADGSTPGPLDVAHNASMPPSPKAYGRCADDGCWYDKDSKLAKGSLGINPGRFAWAKGAVGAYKRARGEGGF